jgi:hypothetical protein
MHMRVAKKFKGCLDIGVMSVDFLSLFHHNPTFCISPDIMTTRRRFWLPWNPERISDACNPPPDAKITT